MSGNTRTIMTAELSDGTWFRIDTSGPLTAASAGEVLEYVMLYERMLKKRETDRPRGDALLLLRLLERVGSNAIGDSDQPHVRIEQSLMEEIRETLAERRNKRAGGKP